MKKTLNCAWDVILFVIMFFLLQTIALIPLQILGYELQGMTLAIGTCISGLLTIALFISGKWTPLSVLNMRPAKELVWVGILSAALLIPSAWADELLGIEMDDDMTQILIGVMSGPIGFISVGLIAPIAEEFVFRGAILRRLLAYFDGKYDGNNSWLSHNSHWIAIAISALLFALVHGNMAQGLHAFVIGLLLGWLYYSTKSIWPGIVLHLVNNSLAALQMNMMDMEPDAPLTEMFGGNATQMYTFIIVSTVVAAFALKMTVESIKQDNLDSREF